MTSTYKVSTGIAIDRSTATSREVEKAISKAGGKISYAKFMEISLYGADGYYSSGKANVGVDFNTCPTDSALFGGTIGKTAKKIWESMGKPTRFTFVESGAGNGIMAKDLLVWARENEPAFYNALEYVIIEIGSLIQKQKETLLDTNPTSRRYRVSLQEDPFLATKDFHKVTWKEASSIDLPLKEVEGILFSNELPDVFPSEIVKKINNEIKQKYVSLENDTWIELWETPAKAVQVFIETYDIATEEGIEVEISLQTELWQKKLNTVLKKGAIITIDYAYAGLRTSEERAARTYPHDTLYAEYQYLGAEDITVEVRFDVLQKRAIEDGLHLYFQGTQDVFLRRHGMDSFIKELSQKYKNTKSIKELLSLSQHEILQEYISLLDLQFTVQVLTKAIDFPEQHMEFHTDFRIRLPFYRPSIKVRIKDVIDDVAYLEKTDEAGMLDFRECNWFFDKKRRYQVYDGETLLIDTNNREALRELVESAGYVYDIEDSS